jgi:type I site-specific restriction endonuclease
MFSVAYSQYDFKIKEVAAQPYIFDSIRKKWIVLTPEEWVRQNFIQYLIVEKNYPKNNIAVEKKIKTFETNSRFDIVVYDDQQKPLLIVECKNQKIPLDKAVVQQVLNYQSIIQSKYLIVTNGDIVVGWLLGEAVQQLKEIPFFEEAIKK